MLTEGMFIADRYEVIGKIGAGGMSDVYKAKDHVLGRYVAIKVLKQEFSDDVNFVTKFRTEAQSAAGLEHPNIVNIYDVGSEDGMHYIVMELIEGITLKTYIEKKGQLSFKEAISIAIQVGRGIEAAHNKHIVHRDIKPQNIIISTEGKVKVTDFGIARAATSNTINSDVMGSVHYASPEQARNGFVDGKSDIYSLGIVMYEMVTGRVPFDGDTTVAVAIQHLQEEMVAPSAYAPDLPISLEKIILKCTQKNPDRRYETIGDLLMDLKKALISPNEDFVTLIPAGVGDKTRIIGDDDISKIKEKTADISLKHEDDDDELDDDEDDDDEEGTILNPKMEKAVTIMGIVAAVIIVIIVVYLIGNMIGLFQFGGSKDKKNDTETEVQTETETDSELDTEMTTMTSILGKTLDEAKTELDALGLDIAQEGMVSSDEYDEGQIVSQSVEDGKTVPKGTTVKVTISSGAGAISVPDVANRPDSEAQKMLEDAGFVVATDFEYSDTIAKDNVTRTDPGTGASAKKGDTITMYISRGLESVQVPTLVGKTQEEAQAALEAVQLKMGNVTSSYSDTVPEGQVISQGIVENKSVDKGTSVSIEVSLGKKTAYYSFNSTVNVPVTDETKTYTKATIVLSDSDGKKLESWKNVAVAEFPKTLTKSDIADISGGVLTITWTYTDEEGATQTEEPVTQDVTFTLQ